MFCLVKGLSVRKVAAFCCNSTASVVRILKGNCSTPSPARSSAKRGNKFKLSERQRRHLISCPRVLRERDRDLTCKRLMEEAVIEERNVSMRTCYLNTAGYLYLQARKKGLMTEDDHRLLKTCEKTLEQIFGRKKFLSTWTQDPLHIREILSIKLLCLEHEYGEKNRGSGSWMYYKRSEGGN